MTILILLLDILKGGDQFLNWTSCLADIIGDGLSFFNFVQAD